MHGDRPQRSGRPRLLNRCAPHKDEVEGSSRFKRKLIHCRNYKPQHYSSSLRVEGRRTVYNRYNDCVGLDTIGEDLHRPDAQQIAQVTNLPFKCHLVDRREKRWNVQVDNDVPRIFAGLDKLETCAETCCSHAIPLQSDIFVTAK